MESDLPTVAHEDSLEFMGHKFRVLVLSDGRRVIPAEDFNRIAELLLGNQGEAVE